MAEFPSQARAVVIGGGIVGCSTAYHLAKLGWNDTVIVERHKLTSGSTHHAAGLVGQLRTSANITQMLGASVALYNTLEAETGLASGWQMNGGLRLACNEARWIELKRQATTARSFGLEMHLLAPKEALALWPIMEIGDLVGAAFLPTDGQVNPSDITQSLAKGARLRGVTILEDTAVTGIELKAGRVAAVLTARGRIACEVVVNCAGQWARQVGQMAGVNVPLVSVQHQYLDHRHDSRRKAGIADAARSRSAHLLQGGRRRPRDGRLRAESDSLGGRRLPGEFQFSAAAAGLGSLPADPRTRDGARAGARFGRGQGTHQRSREFHAGRQFHSGPGPECQRAFTWARDSMRSALPAAGGAGKVLAEWIVGGEAPFDVWPVDIRRFGTPHADIDWVRTSHAGALRQALHHRLAGRGAPRAAGRCAVHRCTTR